ncbi:MAG: N-acetyl-gamma-glutamyl-phosphate reductase, partial [Clostridia bacterium]|nr:N-acetyl-gamma-glutamyl-phosphate reductase [Clostridia bacterium]
VSRAAGEHINVVFVPHLLPVNRGIEETIYCRLTTDMTEDEIRAAYVDFYKDEPFVRIEAKGVSAQIRNVARSNYCDISIHMDKRTGTLILCSCIDNMVKGAAGQAIQNMNLYFGLDEGTGIDMVPAPF